MKPSDLDYHIRRAFEHEAAFLSDLASKSKAYWPYDKEYLQLCKAATHVEPSDIKNWPFIVACVENQIVGFSAACEVKGEKMLDHLWIDPEFIGHGLGRILFCEAVFQAQKLQWTSFTIASDPYAEKFYLKMGAVRIGERESKVKKGFFLPLLEYKFDINYKYISEMK